MIMTTHSQARRRSVALAALLAEECQIADAEIRLRVLQGVDMGRPSEITVNVIEGEPGIRVSGSGSRIE